MAVWNGMLVVKRVYYTTHNAKSMSSCSNITWVDHFLFPGMKARTNDHGVQLTMFHFVWLAWEIPENAHLIWYWWLNSILMGFCYNTALCKGAHPQKDRLVCDENINPQAVFQCPQAVEQSLFVCKQFPARSGPDDGRVVFCHWAVCRL